MEQVALKERTRRLNLVKGILQRLNITDKEKFIAEQSIAQGVTEAKMKEYVRLLIKAGYVKESGLMFEWVGK